MGLSSAILTKDPDQVAGLVQLGADVNALDKNGRTPLMLASSIGSAEIVQMLLAAGARPEFQNEAGETALKLARGREVEKVLRRALVVMRFKSLHQKAAKEISEPLPEQVETIQESIAELETKQDIPAPPKVEKLTERVLDFDRTQPIPMDIDWHANEIKFGAKEIEPVVEETHLEERIVTNPEDVIEETSFISPLIVQEPIQLEELEEEVEEIEIEPDPEIIQEPIQLLDHEEEVEEIEIEPDPEILVVAPEIPEVAELQEEFHEVAIAEEMMEAASEDPFMNLITAQELYTESQVWENRPEFKIVPSFISEKVEEEFIEVPDLLEEEPALEPLNEEQMASMPEAIVEETAFISPLIVPEAININDPPQLNLSEVPKEDQLLEIPNLHEPFISFQFSEPDSIDHERSEPAAAPVESQFDFEESSITYSTAQQLHSKFQEYQDWIELQQPSVDSTWNPETEIYENQEEVVDEPEFITSEEPGIVNCLQCGAAISPNELRCSNCHTTIVRRYCSNCSELIPDHSIFCPYCKIYVTEHFHMPAANGGSQKFAIGATIGLCVLILIMFMTWPSRSSKTAGKGAIRNIIATQKVPNIETPKTAEIMFIPPETKSKPKPEPVKIKSTQAKSNPIKPVEKVKKTITKTPPPVLASTKQRPAPPTKTLKSSVKQVAQKPVDDEKIQHGQTLSSQGVSLIRQGRPGEAIPLLEKSLRSFPKGTKDVHYATALFNLGVAWRMAGRPDIAIPILKKRMVINNQRDEVARELDTAKQQAREAGLGSFQ
jgi:hypothetical protein